MKHLAVLALTILSPVMALAEPELKGTPEELQHYLLTERAIIVISAAGEEKAAVDTAVISLVVKTKEDKFKAALEKNIRIRNELRSRMVAAGISTENIDIAKYSSTPSYGWFGDKPSSYEINNEIKVTLEKENHLLVIADIVDSMNEVRFVNTELRHTGKEQARARALEKALDVMNAKKQLYEKSLGVTLAAVRIVEQKVNEPAPAFLTGMPMKGKSVPTLSSLPASEADIAAESRAPFGEIIYKAQAQVEFVVKAKTR